MIKALRGRGIYTGSSSNLFLSSYLINTLISIKFQARSAPTGLYSSMALRGCSWSTTEWDRLGFDTAVQARHMIEWAANCWIEDCTVGELEAENLKFWPDVEQFGEKEKAALGALAKTWDISESVVEEWKEMCRGWIEEGI